MKAKAIKRQHVTVEGWSCWPIIVNDDGRIGQVVRLQPESLAELNKHRIHFCGKLRHDKCVREKGCQDLCPRSTFDQHQLLGKRSAKESYRELTAKERRRLAAILKNQLSYCRRITITVAEADTEIAP